MSPKEIVQDWVKAFNNADAEQLEKMYAEDAINHQMPNKEVRGRAAIAQMFRDEFSKMQMECIPEQILEDGEWAALEWTDPKGFRGCGFFHIVEGQIQTQRGYWDKLSFEQLYSVTI